ncbi:hypothetical protein HGO38_17265 [Rhizobium sp. CG5]|uniref:esterase-like activity of phytase family protein n=1 Tax=Rhizobium sp. CG5 TaxID=2726076 RepID=UPI002033CBC2|nr:esterase-like activity of phytase family protein [Rhizobium sp. CG5]MCM2475232.1 hypothetical protein [Rhizobium sp. CG5]
MRHTISILALGLALGTSLCAAAAMAEPVQTSSRQIPVFRPGSESAVFGSFEYLGGIEISSSTALFGAWSSVRILPGGRDFIGVLDTGHWMTGRIERDAGGRLAGLADVAIVPMSDARGRLDQGKASMDAESLAIRDGQAIVGFEQRHRVDVYALPVMETGRPLRTLSLPFPVGRLRGNGGLETLAASPVSSPLAGGLVTVSERSVDAKGDLYAGILDGPLKGAFKVARHDEFDVTDGAFLPNGDLLLLERRFGLATGIGMRIRRIDAKVLKPGAVVDGKIVFEAGYSDQIDNMEGLDVVTLDGGEVRVIVVSDDNHSILQRNVMLEFRVID